MRIGIYNALGGQGIGGAELCVSVLAEALAAAHDVEIVHHKEALCNAQLEDMFNVDLAQVALRYVSAPEKSYSILRNPIARYREAREWQADLSKPYDCFFIFTHDVPPFCHARNGVLVVLFATSDLEFVRVFRSDVSPLKKYLKRFYHELEWCGRMRSYRRKFAISAFTQLWTKMRWHVDCGIFYPPAGLPPSASDTGKKRRIISVGRFTTHGHSKRQLEMMNAYVSLTSDETFDYDYCTVGGLTGLQDDIGYFELVRELGARHGASTLANLSRAQLDQLLSVSSIFWHASGYGVDESASPELVEHYGISTVEAMSVGCVPVVIDRGGQREIVEHGVSGFLWNTLGELVHFTKVLIADSLMLKRMSQAAVERSQLFSRSRFVAEATKIVDSLPLD